MIKILGKQRIIILMVLLAVNVATGMLVYSYLVPRQTLKQQELTALKGKISTMQSDINRMQIEFDQMVERKAQFEDLKEKGFFYNQDRRRAELALQSIQEQAGVIAAVATIAPGAVEENAEAQKAEYKILKSTIKIRVDAMESVEIYRYIYMLQRAFPGHLSIVNLNMTRKMEVTGAVLREIATGKNPPLVQADLELAWRTMIPQSEVIGATTP
jgi:hypothetical protein